MRVGETETTHNGINIPFNKNLINKYKLSLCTVVSAYVTQEFQKVDRISKSA